MIALGLIIMLTYTPPLDADLARVEYQSFERHVEPAANCGGGFPGTVCLAPTVPASSACSAGLAATMAERPAVGQVVLLEVRACDWSGNCSPWIGADP